MSLHIDIEKAFGDFSLAVQLDADDEVLGLLGASGSGKSMTLRCVAGIVTPDRGEIILGGRTLYSSAKKINLPPQKRGVGLLFQNYALFPNMTAMQNIAAGVHSKNRRAERIAACVELLRLEGMENRYPHQLSGGQQQRVALARMMASEPEILMLDEPFSALDEQLRHEIEPEFNAALAAFQGTVLYVSHSISEVYRYCTSTAVIREGRVLEIGATKELFLHPHKLETARMLCCRNLAKAENRGDGTAFVPDWGAVLQVPKDAGTFHYLGIHGDDIELCAEKGDNCFPVQLESTADRPRYRSLCLRIPNAPKTFSANCSPALAEQFAQKSREHTAYMRLPSEKLLLLED